jgi:glyoxylase-like metal-dependent hydrolase (beta-lactamase superfamily II)
MFSERKNTISRAHFLRSTGLIASGLLLAPKNMFAQTSPVIIIKNAAAKDPVTVKALRGNLHFMEGSGGNIVVFNGSDGKLMVDGGIAVSQKKINDALSGISTDPLKFLINTHWHFDHADGNEWLHNAGATIIAHENTRKNLLKTIRVADWNYTFPPSPNGAIPATVFSKDHTLQFNRSTIQMNHYPAAHTNSDISVYFPEADVLHVADTWWNAYYPFIDHSSGGTLNGMIKASDYNLKMATDKTIIIPGHGAIGTRNELLQFRDMLETIRENVSKLKKSGRTPNETIAAKPTAAFDAKYGNFVVDPAFFTRLVFVDV